MMTLDIIMIKQCTVASRCVSPIACQAILCSLKFSRGKYFTNSAQKNVMQCMWVINFTLGRYYSPPPPLISVGRTLDWVCSQCTQHTEAMLGSEECTLTSCSLAYVIFSKLAMQL